MAKKNRRSTAAKSNRGNAGVGSGGGQAQSGNGGASGTSRNGGSDGGMMSLGGMRRRAGSVGHSLLDVGSKAVEGVTAHPVPAIMIGAGIAWLLVENVNRRNRFIDRAAENLGRTAGRFGETISEAAGAVGERVGGVAGTVAEAVRGGAGQVGEYVKSGLSAAGGAIRRGTSLVSQGTHAGYEYSRETLAETWEGHPLAVGVAVLAAGVAAGLLLPRTRREDQMMGEMSDGVAEMARSAGQDLVERGKKVANAATSATKRQVKQMGLAPAQLGRKATRIAKSARAAAVVAATE